MAKKTQFSKIVNKRSSVSGVIPTMGPTSDHTDGSWNGTDIYPGEFFTNLADDRLWVGALTGPLEVVIGSTFGAYLPITGGTMSGDIDMSGYSITDLSNFSLISITYSALLSLKSSGDLIPSQKYKVIDRGDQGLILTAIDSNILSDIGLRIMNCPSSTFYTISGPNLGVWYSGLTPTTGDKVVWGGKVWTNDAGVVGTDTDDERLSADWTVVGKPSYGVTSSTYDEKVFNIKYDFDNDWIYEQSDINGNIFGSSYQEELNEFGFGFNPVDICDWNRSLLFNNRCIGIWNNRRTGDISYNQSRYGYISNNSVGTSIIRNYNFGTIRGNSNTGSINDNSNTGAIGNNSNTGNINNNSNNGNINNNSNTGGITYNSNSGYITDNSNSGDIYYNGNIGNIDNNSNNGFIDFNSCFTINDNHNNGAISNNSNNGNISYCNTPATDIYNNINNGDIATYNTAGTLYDTIVNK